MQFRSVSRTIVVIAALAAAGCNNSSSTPQVAPTPSTTGTLTTSTTAASTITVGPSATGFSATVTIPAASAAAHIQIAISTTEPAGFPTVMSSLRMPRNVAGQNISPFGYVTFTPDTNVTLPNSFIIVWKFPTGQTLPDPTHSYVALYDPNNPVDPNNPSAGWTLVTGPATFATDTAGDQFFDFPEPNTPLTLVAGQTYGIVLFSTTTTLATPTPHPTPSPVPTPTIGPSTPPTPTPGPSTSPSASPTPSTSPSASPSPSVSPSPTPHPTATPTATPVPTATPTATPTPLPGFTVQTATASGNGTVTIPVAAGSTGAFAVLANNGTLLNEPNAQVAVSTGTLPLLGTICQTNPSNGQCLAAPASVINAPFTAGQQESFSVFLTSQGTAIVNGTVTVTFSDGAGNTLGSASVTVNTQ
jgi:hypothetical protein